MFNRGPDAGCTIAQYLDFQRCGQSGLQFRQTRFNRIDSGDHVCAGLTLHIENDCWRQTCPCAQLGVLGTVDYLGNI